ncbi:MAG: hypothetical protein HYZ72_21775, partial [Deltaproteobacteria bacterium]|nr:hypothetical protein [Deltaproteobacteria bacterium]
IPPTVRITSPATGDTVIEGSSLPITVEATDDIAVAAVNFVVNGEVVFTDTTAPYQFNFTVPVGVTSLTLGATAIDLGSNIGAAGDVVVNVIPDPGTTAEGRVIDRDRNPVAGATVTCLGISGLTGPEGTFSIPGLPTIRGDIRCTATFVTTDGKTLRGTSAGVSPVRGRITDVGQIIIGRLSSKGTDFWLAFQNDRESNAGAQLFILSDMFTDFTVTGPGFNMTGTASPGTPGIVALPNSLEITTNQVIENKGIHVVSDEEVSVLFFYPTSVTSDIYLGIPTEALGTEYFVVGFQESISARGFSPTQDPSEFVIVATQGNTNVSLVPSCTSLSGTPAGSTVNLVLNQGQTYQYQCGSRGDVTGSLITSDKPTGVIGGNSCADVPPGVAFCDILSEMMFPVASLYATEFFTAPLPGASADIIRILAAQDNTTVTVNDGSSLNSFSLNRGQFRELSIEPATRITSDKPITVVQYAVGINRAGIGDPFEMQILPTGAFRDTYRLFAPSGFSPSAIIIAPNSAVPSVTLNGLPVTGFAPLPGGTHQFVVTSVPTGQSVVAAAEPIGVYGIGFTSFGSYGYPAGF